MASSDPNNFVLQSGISDQAQQMLTNFWPNAIDNIKNLNAADYKTQELPLARIKKIMKLDEDVKMISAEAPVLFAKAAEIFVSELSLRAWIHTEDNKRRTLQRNDIATAISKYDQFDFLIDIVPREELKPTKRADELTRGGTSLPEQIQYYLQLAQQQSQQQQQQLQQQQSAQQTPTQVQPATTPQPAPVVQQAVTVQQPSTSNTTQQTTSIQLAGGLQQPFQVQQQGAQPQVIQLPQQVTQQTVLQQLQQQQQQLQTQAQQQTQQQQQQQPQQQQQQQIQVQTQAQQQQQQQQPTQVYQQVINASGQVETIPIQVTPQQLQAFQLQLQNKLQGGQLVMGGQGDQSMFQIQQGAAGQQGIFTLPTGEEQSEGTGDS